MQIKVLPLSPWKDPQQQRPRGDPGAHAWPQGRRSNPAKVRMASESTSTSATFQISEDAIRIP